MGAESPLMIGFENWMDRGNDKGWRRLSDDRLRVYWNKFISNLAKRTGRNYSDAHYERRSTWK